MTRKTLVLALAVSLSATACFGSPGDTGAPEPEPSDSTPTEPDPTGDAELPCDGGAFPDDEEFRELLCAVQWTQLDVAGSGGEIDPEWVSRSAEAVLLYADDRAGAVAQLEAILAEMDAVIAGAQPEPDTIADVVPGHPDQIGLRDCMVEVASLIVRANVEAGFDPTRVDEWQDRAEQVEPLVEAGDLAGAEVLVCELRDEIAAAIDDPSLVGS